MGLNARGVAKYSDFLPLKCYISETVQDTIVLITNGKSYIFSYYHPSLILLLFKHGALFSKFRRAPRGTALCSTDEY